MTGQRDKDVKVTETSEEEALVPQHLANIQLGLDGLLREKAINLLHRSTSLRQTHAI